MWSARDSLAAFEVLTWKESVLEEVVVPLVDEVVRPVADVEQDEQDWEDDKGDAVDVFLVTTEQLVCKNLCIIIINQRSMFESDYKR